MFQDCVSGIRDDVCTGTESFELCLCVRLWHREEGKEVYLGIHVEDEGDNSNNTGEADNDGAGSRTPVMGTSERLLRRN